jgi:hypothetical protein
MELTRSVVDLLASNPKWVMQAKGESSATATATHTQTLSLTQQGGGGRGHTDCLLSLAVCPASLRLDESEHVDHLRRIHPFIHTHSHYSEQKRERERAQQPPVSHSTITQYHMHLLCVLLVLHH